MTFIELTIKYGLHFALLCWIEYHCGFFPWSLKVAINKKLKRMRKAGLTPPQKGE